MTGFASARGAGPGFSWGWELRGVNGKGLDLRCRVPDWVSGLEQGLRAAISKQVARGSITLSLRLVRDEGSEANALNTDALTRAIHNVELVEAAARAAGVTLAPTRATDLLIQKGVQEVQAEDQDAGELSKLLIADFAPVLADFVAMRGAEGAALDGVIGEQIKTIETLTAKAKEAAEARKPQVEETFRENLSKLLDNSDGLDEARLAQELALLAVKADVTEEIDRLAAHVAAARELLTTEGPIGRKLDFLMQEFMREANTLCSKSQDAALTAIGLDLKATIDQMREQVQNVE